MSKKKKKQICNIVLNNTEIEPEAYTADGEAIYLLMTEELPSNYVGYTSEILYDKDGNKI